MPVNPHFGAQLGNSLYADGQGGTMTREAYIEVSKRINPEFDPAKMEELAN